MLGVMDMSSVKLTILSRGAIEISSQFAEKEYT